MNDSIIGKIIDTYEITGILGKGGMGVVYQARDTTLDRMVALKMMDASVVRDEEFLKRFRSEAKALARLQNPNIVAVFALRETQSGLCLVMEYIDGGTLADRIRQEGAIPPCEAVVLFRQLATALDHAHAVGVIHRDIKPANVMLTAAGQAKLTDFGLAKIQEPAVHTMTVGTGGTLYYMSPEQIKGLAKVDTRGDIYSLGMTLYETVVGRVPFPNNLTDFEIRQAIVDGKIPPPQKFRPDLPEQFTSIIAKAIHKDPSKRYQTAGAFCNALAEVSLPQQSPNVRNVPIAGRMPARRVPTTLRKVLGPVLAVCCVVVAGYLGYQFLAQTDATTTKVAKPVLSPNVEPSLPHSKARLSITTFPTAAAIELGDSIAGVSPLHDVVIAGQTPVRVRIAAAGYVAKETMIVATEGAPLALSFTLEKMKVPRSEGVAERTKGAMARLEVSALPHGIVSVDGGEKSRVSERALRLEVPAGRRRVLFEHPQYGTREATVTLGQDEVRELRCYFEAQVNVAISGDAVWGMIVLDGVKTTIQAPKILSLGPGRHRIAVERSGYEAVEGEQIVETRASFEPSVHRLAFTLKKK